MTETIDPSVAASNSAFMIRDLAVLAYAQGFTLWHYRADAERLPLTSQPRFFDAAADLVTGGDVIVVSAPTGAKLLVITETEGGVATAAVS